MAEAKRDSNYVPTLLAVNNSDGTTPVVLWADPTTHRLLVDVSGGSGTASTDDSAFTAGSGSGTPAMGFYQSSPDSVDDGDVGVLGMTADRQLKVSIETDNVGIGGGTQYTEDDAAAANPVGNAQILVRADSPAGITSADGDNVAQRGTDYGAAFVQLVTSSGSFIDSVGGGTEYNEDAATPATQTGSAIMMERDDALSTVTPIEGDWIGLRGTAEGALWVQDFNSDALLTAAQAVQTAVEGTLTVGSHAVTNAGTFAVQVDGDALTALQLIDNIVQAEDAVHGSGDSGVMALAVRNDTLAALAGTDGDYAPLQVNATGALYVAVDGSVTVDLGANNDVVAAGDVAHDSADSGNPVKIGAKAVAVDGTAPGTDVAENDRTDLKATLDGRLLTEMTHPNFWHVSADYAAAQTNTTVKAAPGAGLKLYITDVIISNGATAGNITLLDGSGGTVLLELYPAINGGMTHSFRNPIALTANTLLAITSTTVTTHSVTISGYIAA